MADRIQYRRDTAARWAQYNPILLEGEVGYITDNDNQFKIGDGVHAWNDLPIRGFNGNVVQETGTDANAVMSQKAVTENLSTLQNQTSSVGYVSCNTAAGTAAKTIAVTGLTSLTTGIRLLVKMENNNTANDATLNINSLGAKPLYYNNNRVSGSNTWEAGEVIEVYYDGTNFHSSNILGGAGGSNGNMILEWNTDVATTRKQVKASERKAGMQISYLHPDNGWTNEQYIGTAVTDTEWEKDDNWSEIASSDDLSDAYDTLSGELNYNDMFVPDDSQKGVAWNNNNNVSDNIFRILSNPIEIERGVTYRFTKTISGGFLAFFLNDLSNELLSVGTITSSEADSDEYVEFTNTNGYKYVRVNFSVEEMDISQLRFCKADNWKPAPDIDESIIEKEMVMNLYDCSTQTLGAIINSDGSITEGGNANNYAVSDYIHIQTPGYYSLKIYDDLYTTAIYDKEEMDFLRLTSNSENSTIKSNNGHFYIMEECYIRIVYLYQKYVDYVLVNNSNQQMLCFGKKDLTNASPNHKISILETLYYPNLAEETPWQRFKGKKILFTGDSITEKNFRAEQNYIDYLQTWLGFEYDNDGKSGTGIVKPSGGNQGALTRLDSIEEDYDMIFFMGNMNDGTGGSGSLTELGSFGDSEATTVYGAWDSFINKLLTKWPNASICIASSTPRSQNGTLGLCWGIENWYEEWVKASKEVCANYSIPFLDLYHNSGLRPWNKSNNKEYFSCDASPDGDGIHPNSKGHLLLAYKIYEFFKMYM